MTAIRKTTGFVLAAAAASMFVAGSVAFTPTPAAADGVKCAGINSCKGHSECATASSSCKGQNACKGHGWLELTKAECDKIEGAKFEPAS